jgi:hypothetical protein
VARFSTLIDSEINIDGIFSSNTSPGDNNSIHFASSLTNAKINMSGTFALFNSSGTAGVYFDESGNAT